MVGLRLDDAGTEDLSWLDLLEFCRHSQPGSAVFDALNPEYVTYEQQFLRSMEHSLRLLVWFKTKDGQKGRHQPERWPLPGDEKPNDGYTPMTTDEMDAFLGWSPRGRE